MNTSGAARNISSRLWAAALIAVLLLSTAAQPAAGAPAAQTPPPPAEQRENDYRRLEPGAIPAGGPAVQAQAVSGMFLTEGFEGTFPSGGWSTFNRGANTSGPYWGPDDDQPRTGTKSAWPARAGANAVDPSSYSYPDGLDTWMVYGPVDLTNAASSSLAFYYTNVSESNADYFGWYASVDGEHFYGQKVSGDSGADWQQVTFDLAAVPDYGSMIGQAQVYIAFTFTSDVDVDNSTFYDGAFVDDIQWSASLNAGTNLTPVTPAGWSAAVVPSFESGTKTTGTLYAMNDSYIDWAVLNEGDAVPVPFRNCLYLDTTRVNCWDVSGGLGAVQTYTVQDWLMQNEVASGEHTLRLVVDSTNAVAETNETDNEYTAPFTWDVLPKPNLQPYKPSGWSFAVVPSNSMNDTILKPLSAEKTTRIHWAIRNNGAEVSSAFRVNLYYDNTFLSEWVIPSLEATITTYNKNYVPSVTISPGEHTLKLVVDPENLIDEYNEADNTYEQTFTWAGTCVSVSVNADPAEGGTASVLSAPTCAGGKYTLNSVVSLQAQPSTGNGFVEWTYTMSGNPGTRSNNPLAIAVSSDVTFTAHFVRCYDLDLSVSPPGSGELVISPPPNCGDQYRSGTVVSLDAVANAGYTFYQWTGPAAPVAGHPTQGTVVMDADQTVTAQFLVPPVVPVLLAPSDGSTVTVLSPTLSWKSSASGLSYTVEIAENVEFTGAKSVTGLTETQYLPDPPLESLKTYYWRVKSYNLGGMESGWSAVRSFKTPASAPALSAPENGSKLSTLQAVLSWLPVDSAASYTVQLSTSALFRTTLLNKTVKEPRLAITSDLRYRDADIYWRVRATIARKPGAWSAVWSFHTPNPPGIPTLLKPANGSLTTVPAPLLDWSDVKAPAGLPLVDYQVQLSVQPDFSDPVQIDQKTGTVSKLQIDSDLPPNTRWYWRVRALNDHGQMSAWSRVYSFRTALLPPALLQPEPDAQLKNNRPVFDWEAVDGATSYSLQYSIYPDFLKKVTTKPAKNSELALSTDLPSSQTLYWRVRSNGANGPSLWSDGRMLVTANPPTAPALLSPASNALLLDETPRLAWKAAKLPALTALKYYEVEIAADALFATGVKATTLSQEYIPETAMQPNTRYWWRVRAYNTADEYSNWSAPRTFRVAVAAPALASPGEGDTTALTRPLFAWQAVEGAGGYTVQVAAEGSAFSSIKATGSVKSLTWTCSKSLPAGNYIWRVRATGANGPGNWSEARHFTVAP